jgi:hypothetical protein
MILGRKNINAKNRDKQTAPTLVKMSHSSSLITKTPAAIKKAPIKSRIANITK